MAELLLEILSEEIPARMQARAASDLERLVTDGLKKAGLPFDTAAAYVTPRRLALVVDGLPEKQPDVSEERRGPRIDAPEKAINGFLGSVGLTLEQCGKREEKKGTFLVAVIEKAGQATAEVLPEIIVGALSALPWPKSMRWGEYGVRWVRPLQGIVCLFDGVVVPFTFDPRTSGDTTVGHRFLAPRLVAVGNFADYEAKLLNAYVMLDREERKALIKERADALAASEGLKVKDDPGLLDEVTGLVEWPAVHMGRIDEAFMDVPPEVLTTAMKTHQKYFSVLDADGNLAPRFIVVANTEATDGGAEILAGNERVLRARLSDAKFFWDQDRKASLESRVPKLAERIFHAKLGSDLDKVERMRKLARELAPYTGADPDLAERAALLCKADLSSEMVGEFPELQGLMGRYYAQGDGETAEIAEAVADHYSPLGPNDACPTEPLSVAVALADKIDTLVGFFGIDEKPTGSKDPFALRRAALGVIRLILENGLRISLAGIFRRSYDAYVFENERVMVVYSKSGLDGDPNRQYDFDRRKLGFLDRSYDKVLIGKSNTLTSSKGDVGIPDGNFVGHLRNHNTAIPDLLAFFADRLKVHLKESGVRHDLVTAVFALGGEDDLVRLLARVEALEDFLGTDDGANLQVAYARAANIVRIEEKKDKTSYDQPVDGALLVEAAEKNLHSRLEAAGPRIDAAVADERFADAMAVLAELRAPVDAFFDHVTVNCDEPELRANRLRLLSRIRSALEGVADFSKIEG